MYCLMGVTLSSSREFWDAVMMGWSLWRARMFVGDCAVGVLADGR